MLRALCSRPEFRDLLNVLKEKQARPPTSPPNLPPAWVPGLVALAFLVVGLAGIDSVFFSLLALLLLLFVGGGS